MNELRNAILTRRSIRRYKDAPVPKEILSEILTAGTYAATGKNLQSPIMIAVTNKELRDKMSALNAKVMGSEGTDPFYGAPAVIVVLAEKKYPNYLYDGTLVMANLMLSAHAHGLGSCWINRAREVYDSPEGKAILAELGIEGEFEGIGNCIVGYIDGEYPEAKPRKENYIYWAE